jgi:protein CpxP
MTTRFKTSLAAGLVAIAMAGAVPVLMAQDAPQRRGGPGGERMRGPGAFGPELRGLDLTDDQRAQLRKIRQARQSEFKAAGEKLGAARQGMRALIEADAINESAIRAKSAEVAAAEAEVAILNAKVRAESLQILTSEQQAKLKELRTSRQGQMKQRRGPRGQ